MLHLGTLLAIIIIFRERIARVLKAMFRGRVRYKKGTFRFPNEDTRWAWLLVMATIPAAVIGVLWGGVIEKEFCDPFRVGICLLITGGVLFGTRLVPVSAGEPNWRRALAVGIAQIGGIIPGISRSGITISAGIYSGMERERAVEFSFLLAIPLILGAGVSKIAGMIKMSISFSEIMNLLAGTLTAAVSGYVAIKVLLKIVKKGRFDFFAYYCWITGLIVILLMK